jgi:FixJ family two-component response regulator
MTERPGTVFVVDDDLSVRRGLERLLRAVGHRVESFASAREFLERRSNERPACLVLDVRMPGQTGLDLRDELQAAGCRIPVIFITGHGDIPMAVQAMKAGAADFLTKPFDEDVLLHAVDRALARDHAGDGGRPPAE